MDRHAQSLLRGRLVVGLYSAEPALIEQLAARLALEFGEMALQSERWSAGETHCQWLALAEVAPGQLAAIKQHTLRVEQLYLDGLGQRRIGLEVGLVDALRFIRATGHDAPHRIYLAPGVWGEVPLVWDEASEEFTELSWTARPGAGSALSETAKAFLRLVRLRCLDWASPSGRSTL